MSSPAKVPLVEQLRRVPKDARHVICDTSKDFAESTSIPYGRMCHEAADEIDLQREELLRTWFVLKEYGHHPGRTDDRLSDCVRRAFDTLVEPAAEREPLVSIGKREIPCGECRLRLGERCDVCGARAIESEVRK